MSNKVYLEVKDYDGGALRVIPGVIQTNGTIIFGDANINLSNTGLLLTTAGVTDSADKRFMTDAQQNVLAAATGGVLAGSLVAGAAPNAINFAGVVPASEVNGSLITTISTWVEHTAAGACAGKILAASSAVTGDFATWRMRGRSDAAVANGSNVASVEGVNSSASANINNYANLFGVQGLAQPNAFTQANSGNIICGVYSCMDRSGTDAGSAWSMWIDDHSTTAKAASHYLLRMSQNALGGSPVNIDGAITMQTSRLPQLFNFEQVDGFLSVSGSGSFTKTHKLAVKIAGDATQYYIQLGTII